MLKRNHKKSTRREQPRKTKRGSHLRKIQSKKKQEKIFTPKRKFRLNLKALAKLLLVVILIVVAYEVYNTKQELNKVNEGLDNILNKIESLETDQNYITEKQIEMEQRQDALEISKAEKKAEEERLAKEKAEAEEKARQEAIKVAQAKTAQVTSRGGTTSRSSSTVGSTSDYQSYAHDLCINTYGWSENDYQCLVKLWNRESGWNPNAHNSSSGAHGIPQSLPASKMASEGDDYYTNGYTQIRWGLKYIKSRYGTPSNAWSHSQSTGWY